MRNEFEYSDQRRSRGARVIVVLSTIGVALIAAWVFAPILLANYAATITAIPTPRAIDPPVITPARAATPATNATASAIIEEAPAPALSTTIVASAAPQPFEPAATLLATPWPKDAPASPGGPARLASVEPAAATTEATEIVPLPRKRPSATIAARLAIPLPRPRPEIEGDVPAAELSAFEAQVQRQRE
jgi:hypothetical protein